MGPTKTTAATTDASAVAAAAVRRRDAFCEALSMQQRRLANSHRDRDKSTNRSGSGGSSKIDLLWSRVAKADEQCVSSSPTSSTNTSHTTSGGAHSIENLFRSSRNTAVEPKSTSGNTASDVQDTRDYPTQGELLGRRVNYSSHGSTMTAELTLDAIQRSDPTTQPFEGVTAADVDENVLSELPPEMAREVRRQMELEQRASRKNKHINEDDGRTDSGNGRKRSKNSTNSTRSAMESFFLPSKSRPES